MEIIQSNIVSIMLWLIVSVLSFRHVYKNWKFFRLSYRNVLLITIPISLTLLLMSVWSDLAIYIFLLVALIASYIKMYRSRLERTSLATIIDDKYLLLKFPVQTHESNMTFRVWVYLWHLSNDILALVLVTVLGYILDRSGAILELITILK